MLSCVLPSVRIGQRGRDFTGVVLRDPHPVQALRVAEQYGFFGSCVQFVRLQQFFYFMFAGRWADFMWKVAGENECLRSTSRTA